MWGGGGSYKLHFREGVGGGGREKNIFVTETLVKLLRKMEMTDLFKKLAFSSNWFKNCATTAIVNLQPIF